MINSIKNSAVIYAMCFKKKNIGIQIKIKQKEYKTIMTRKVKEVKLMYLFYSILYSK